MWRKQWYLHITDYKEKYQSTLLLSHLDDQAAVKGVRLKNKYDRAMVVSDQYYNSHAKVIAACIRKVGALPVARVGGLRGVKFLQDVRS